MTPTNRISNLSWFEFAPTLSRGRRNRSSRRNDRCFAIRSTLRAEVFDDPFVAGDRFGDRALHQFFLRVDLRAAGNPFGPHELLGLHTRGLWIVVLAHKVALLATRLTGTRDAEFLTPAAPAGRGDFFVFTHEPADLLAALGASAVRTATTAGTSTARNDTDHGERQKSPHDDRDESLAHEIPHDESNAGQLTS